MIVVALILILTIRLTISASIDPLECRNLRHIRNGSSAFCRASLEVEGDWRLTGTSSDTVPLWSRDCRTRTAPGSTPTKCASRDSRWSCLHNKVACNNADWAFHAALISKSEFTSDRHSRKNRYDPSDPLSIVSCIGVNHLNCPSISRVQPVLVARANKRLGRIQSDDSLKTKVKMIRHQTTNMSAN